MDLAKASEAIKKATNVYKALKDVDEALDAMVVLNQYAQETKALNEKIKKDSAAASVELEAKKVGIKAIEESNATLINVAKMEAAAIKGKAVSDGSASAAKTVEQLNARAGKLAEDIKSNSDYLANIKNEIASANETLKVRNAALEDLRKLIESTKAQFKAIGG